MPFPPTLRRGLTPLRCLLFTITLAATTVASAQSRVLETAYGEITIEGTPKRIVTLHEAALDTAVAIGTSPLAAVTTRGADGVAGYIQQRVTAIEIVGTPREINIEAVLALEPDIILAAPRLAEAQYRLLSDIAPTVVPPGEGFQANQWKRHARLYARALGRSDRIDQAIERIEAQAAELATRITERHGDDDRKAYLARWMPQGPMVMSSRLFSTGLLQATGFEVSDADLVSDGRPHSDPLSLEALSRIDGDWLFLATLNEDGREALRNARESPAFTRLDVARRDRAVPVDGQLWTSASGPLAARAVLDDIRSAALP